ncbi:hypothetical protein Q7P35_010648 [Cladosporium inversicolor]
MPPVLPAKRAAGTPLAPSVEKAYYRKCIQLKRRLNEVEAANEEARTRRVRLDRAIMKMRLERAFLLEQLSKRVEPNVEGSDASGEEGPGTTTGAGGYCLMLGVLLCLCFLVLRNMRLVLLLAYSGATRILVMAWYRTAKGYGLQERRANGVRAYSTTCTHQREILILQAYPHNSCRRTTAGFKRHATAPGRASLPHSERDSPVLLPGVAQLTSPLLLPLNISNSTSTPSLTLLLQ